MLRVSVVKPLLPRAEVSVLRHWQEQLCHGRPSWIGVSLPWKTEYPDGCSTIIRCVARKMGLYNLEMISLWECNFQMGGLAYDKLQDIICIIVITNAITAAKWIFDSSVHLYQLHSIVISKNLRCFFKKNSNNAIAFWNCPDSIKWSPHFLVDKKSKCIKIDHIFPSKMSWGFRKKEECNIIVKQWQIFPSLRI